MNAQAWPMAFIAGSQQRAAIWGGCEGLLWCTQADRGRKRMAFLLKQAEVFQHFAPATAASESKK